MTPIEISTLTLGNHAGDLPNVRVLLRMTVEEIKGSRMTLLSFESEDCVGETRRDHLVLCPDIAEGIAGALRTVLVRRGLGEAGS
jgi:hypothetical protein